MQKKKRNYKTLIAVEPGGTQTIAYGSTSQGPSLLELELALENGPIKQVILNRT